LDYPIECIATSVQYNFAQVKFLIQILCVDEGIMQNPIAMMASRLAQDDTVGSDEIAEAIDYLDTKIQTAKDCRDPLPFAAFRTKTLLVAALRLRQEAGLSL